MVLGFTVLYPYRPAGGGRDLYINKNKFILRRGPWREPAALLPGGRPPVAPPVGGRGLPPGRGAAGSCLRPVGHFLARAMMLLRFLACAIAREDEPVETKTRPHASTKTANQRVLLPGRGRCNRCRGSCRLGQWRPGNMHDADRPRRKAR